MSLRARVRKILDEISRDDLEYMAIFDRIESKVCNDPACTDKDCVRARIYRDIQ